MIQQIVLPYILLNKLPKLLFDNSTYQSQTTILTEYYINNIQSDSVLEDLKNSENYILDLLLNMTKKHEKYLQITNKYFEYLEILNIQMLDINNKIEITFYNNNEKDNLFHAVNDICMFKKIDYTIKENYIDYFKIQTVFNEITNEKTSDLIFYDLIQDNVNEINEMLQALPKILFNLKKNGNLIICLHDTYSTAMMDILFYLNCIFKKVFISRPLIMNVHNKHRYIVCKNLQNTINNFDIMNLVKFVNQKILNCKDETKKITSKSKIFDCKIPIFFKQKLSDINCIYGQLILENTMLYINNKNYEIALYYKNLLNIVNDWIELHKIYLPFNNNDFDIEVNINLSIENIISHLEKKTDTDES